MADHFSARGEHARAITLYKKYIAHAPESRHAYAMACHSIASYYGRQGDAQREEEYLIRSAISDKLAINHEGSSLRQLAMLLLQREPNHVERAERYIFSALDDARFYGTRLRTFEAAQDLPAIAAAYKQAGTERNRLQWIALALATTLAVAAATFLWVVVKKNRRLRQREHQLAQGNQLLTTLNERLDTLNAQLTDTSVRRESLAKLFIDLCARYIDRYGKYQTLVKRKIKAHQTQELLTIATSTRLGEEDAAVFLHRFDQAFLGLYPTFADELNALLRPEGRIAPNAPPSLTAEQRIYALVRLGVKDSSEIASLLFFSPQTVYNYRSAMRNRAIERETFEDNVRQLCLTMGD